jgi:stage III sporulation protein AB
MDIAVKVGAACVMTAASAMGGRLFSLTHARRTRVLREILSGLKRLEIEMLEHRLPMKEALSACGSIFEQTAQEMGKGIAPQTAYERCVPRLRRRGGLLDSLQDGDMTALRRLFAALGEGGLHRQRLLLHEAAGELEQLREQAQIRQQQNGRLYTSLSALGGLAAALLMM